MVLQVTPDQAGEYGVICNEYCGIGHHLMVGKIYVGE
jgi:cytochrome c oxidase subunit 2